MVALARAVLMDLRTRGYIRLWTMRTAILPILLDPATEARQCEEREAWLANPDASRLFRAREVWGCPCCVWRCPSRAAAERQSEFERRLEVESC